MGNIFSVDSPSCDQFVQPFLPFLCGKWKYFYNLEENLEALQKEMQDLNAMRNDLLKRVSKEEDRGLQGLQEVKGWISMVEEIEPKANRLLDESVFEIRRHEIRRLSTYYYNEDVVVTLRKVEALRSKGVFEDVIDRALPSLVVKMPPIQLTVSQKELLERAWNCLLDKNALGIYGRGGVGKATLLTQIKKKFLEAGEAFGLVIFVVVASEEVEICVQEEISKRLGLQWGRETKKEKAAEILRVLNGKRFVLLLDGIQRDVDLEEIGVPFPSRENGCKIVFTTRSREACESKWVDGKVEVKCLSPEESWDLFQKTVGQNTLRSHPDIPKLARVVASSCRGLPLALTLIGETMARKRTVGEWRYTIHVLASSTAEFPDMEDEFFLPILKFIYDNMSGENIRLCFLYCALFPKNCDMRKEDLVDYWISEEIIAKEDRGIAEIQGNEMIGDLVRMRLLMEDESGYRVKMHGMVRQMALWIASDLRRSKVIFLVKFGEKINQMLKVDNWSMVRWMSVTSTQIENISDSPACSELTTLFLQGNSNLEWISGDFIRWMTSLVVLNLSSNRELAELPEEVSSLVSLQFLNLSFTSIKRLPLAMKELTRLIHLDLEHTHELPDIKVIASLFNLQVLRLLWSVPLNISLMENIQLLKSLKELSLTVKEDAVLEQLISIHRLASCIRRLHLKRITITDGGISLLNAMFSLRELHVDECDIPEIAIDRRSNTIERKQHDRQLLSETVPEVVTQQQAPIPVVETTGEGNSQCSMIYARRIDITHSEKPKNWMCKLNENLGLCCLFVKVGYMCKLNENLGLLNSALVELLAKRVDVLTRVEAGEFNGGTRLAIVVVWLSQVDTIETNTTQLIDEFYGQDTSSQDASTSCCWSTDNISNCCLGEKVFKMLDEVRNLYTRGEFDVVTQQVPSPVVETTGEGNSQCSMIYARRIDITHSEKPENWTWSSILRATKRSCDTEESLLARHKRNFSYEDTDTKDKIRGGVRGEVRTDRIWMGGAGELES